MKTSTREENVRFTCVYHDQYQSCCHCRHFFSWAKLDYDPAQSYYFAEWTSSKLYTIFMISVCLLVPLSAMSYYYYNIIRFHKEWLWQKQLYISRDSELHVQDPDSRRQPKHKNLIRTIFTFDSSISIVLVVLCNYCYGSSVLKYPCPTCYRFCVIDLRLSKQFYQKTQDKTGI